MILVRVPDAASDLRRPEAIHKVLVKNVSKMHPLLDNCLRLTVGTRRRKRAAAGRAESLPMTSTASRFSPRTSLGVLTVWPLRPFRPPLLPVAPTLRAATRPRQRSRVASSTWTAPDSARSCPPASASFDHMLDQIARHGLIDLDIQAEGDLHIDGHHTVEDVGISLGQAVAQAVGDKKGHPPLRPRLCAAGRGAEPRGDRLLRPTGPA
jgi:hypothetical protein